MPPMRRLRLRRCLAIAALLLVGAVTFDMTRAPEEQLLAGGYILLVHAYQHHGHALTDGWIACRYHPTCSRYSVEAVERYGLARGLSLTIRRIASCQSTVPVGTRDPVP